MFAQYITYYAIVLGRGRFFVATLYTPLVSIFSFYLYFFLYLLTCTGHTVDRMNIVRGS